NFAGGAAPKAAPASRKTHKNARIMVLAPEDALWSAGTRPGPRLGPRRPSSPTCPRSRSRRPACSRTGGPPRAAAGPLPTSGIDSNSRQPAFRPSAPVAGELPGGPPERGRAAHLPAGLDAHRHLTDGTPDAHLLGPLIDQLGLAQDIQLRLPHGLQLALLPLPEVEVEALHQHARRRVVHAP